MAEMALVKIVVMALMLMVVTVRAFVTPSAFTGRKEALLTGQGSRITAMPRMHNRRGSTTMVVIDVGSTEELDKIVNDKNVKLVVVDYSTTWCGPCKLILPKFEELAEEYKDVVFIKVIGDKTNESSKLMKREGVRSVPSFHFWKEGKKVDSVNGANVDALVGALGTHI